MLTKVVEPGLGFLVLFTDPRSDDALASYDVSKLQLSIAGYRQCIISDISNRLRYGASGCQVHSRKGVPWSVRMIAAGVRLNEPQIFFAKISKDEESSFDVDVGILKSKIEILFFCTKTQEIDRQIILTSNWRWKIGFWRQHGDSGLEMFQSVRKCSGRFGNFSDICGNFLHVSRIDKKLFE